MASRILLRFNTKFADDPEKRTWRVLVDGEETLAHKVLIKIPCETITEPIATGEIKHHFLCYGKVEWLPGDIAEVVPGEN